MNNRIEQLTFTRFLAALTVVMFHGAGGIYFQALAFPFLDEIITSAPMAVSYLYVLSGFVMALAHYRPGEKTSLEEYWKARLTRLYPLYLAAFLFTCYYYGLGPLNARTEEALAHLLMAQAWIPKYVLSYNFPAWSVSVEIFFYALFPAFAWWAARQPIRRVIAVSLAIWALVQTVHHALWIGFYPQAHKFLIYFPLFHLGSFALGAAAGIWFLREGRAQKYETRVTLPLLALGVFLASLYVVVSARVSSIPREGQLMTGLLSPFLALALLALAFDSSRLTALFKRPALIALGETSYAVYIFHIPLRWTYERALERLDPARAQATLDATYVPLLLAFSFLAAFYFDRPLRLRLKKALQNVSLLSLAFDLMIFAFSVYVSFDLRFKTMRIRDEHYLTFRLMFWSALALRPLMAAAFGALNLSARQWIQPALLATAVGSAALTGVLYVGYAGGWASYFPLSVLALDFSITLGLALLARFALRFSFRKAGAAAQAS